MIPAEGDRIRLIAMGDDPDPIPSGTEGKVTRIIQDPWGHAQVAVTWDNGRSLMLVIPPDAVEVLSND